MPLEDSALTTVAALNAWLGSQRTTAVERLELAINISSEAVIDYVQREFVAVDNQTRTFRYAGAGYLSLAPHDLREADSISLTSSGSTTPRVLAGVDFDLQPEGKTPEGTYTWIRGLPVTYARRAVITIAGDWGIGFVPARAEGACLITATEMIVNPEGTRQLMVGDVLTVIPDRSTDALPLQARALLKRLRHGTTL